MITLSGQKPLYINEDSKPKQSISLKTSKHNDEIIYGNINNPQIPVVVFGLKLKGD